MGKIPVRPTWAEGDGDAAFIKLRGLQQQTEVSNVVESFQKTSNVIEVRI